MACAVADSTVPIVVSDDIRAKIQAPDIDENSPIAMDLSQYTLAELKQLRARIARQIEKQQSAGKASVLRKINELAREYGLSLEDLLADSAGPSTPKAASKSAAARKSPLPAKYRHPSKRDLGWSGRGRKPQWVAAWLASGGSLAALEVRARKLAKKAPAAPASTDVGQTEPATSGSDATDTAPA
jgi:DNA-binding protein H-NS